MSVDGGSLEIGMVARQLGVAPSTLRSWERRYQLVVPRRGPSGQRLYDSDQVQLLQGVIAQVRRGARAGAAHRSTTMATLASVELASVERVQLEPGPDAPRRARQLVDRLAVGLEDRKLAFFLRLVASELVTDAVQHASGRGSIDVQVQLFDAAAHVSVHSRRRFSLKGVRERKRAAGPGLEIVEALADSWTIDTGPYGTTISVRLSGVG